MKVSRRHLLGAAASIGAASLAMPLMGSSYLKKGRRPKNIIFAVVDGMAIQTLSMHDQLMQIKDGKPSYWSTLLKRDDVTLGFQDTRSLNSLVTDSAAASSAWGSGRHVWNGMLNMFPDKTKLKTLAQSMIEKGVRCGLVTTSTITHATPAGFSINCIQRDLEGLIAEEYLTSGVDILLGGGDKFFSPELRKDKKDLYGDFSAKGYKLVKDRKSLIGLKSNKILGIFSSGHLPFTVDRDNDAALAEKIPTLAEMTSVALDNLKGSKNGFLLQVEGARVDHGGHSNDIAANVWDQNAFEEALKVIIEFAEKDGDTLVVITADHACGGPSLNGSGDEYGDSTKGLQTLLSMKSSYGGILVPLTVSPTVANCQDLVKSKLGIGLSAPEAQAVVDSIKGNAGAKVSEFYASANSTLAMMLGNHSKITWTSLNHTSEQVIVTAFGPGRENFSGLHVNVSYHGILLALKGFKHENPKMDFEAAKGHLEQLKASIDPEWVELYAAHEDCPCNEHSLFSHL